ncbi:MAG: SDR family oxidoreductase [Gammaproteobacteria bacterium]|nr:SDR family oxidoreductase [Gammaproteobacteria bacterium]
MTRQVLVTGASSGIGLATARLLQDKGYNVTGISRRNVSQEKFRTIQLDLTNSLDIDRCFKQLLKESSFDGYVHAAGYGEFGSIEQFSVAQIERAIQVNLTSALLIARQLVPAFRKQQSGRLIFIGSESALNAGRKGVLYSAAKFGLRGFCQALREDCASDGIQVSLINPGMVRSPFFDNLSFAPASLPENAIEPAQVAELVDFILASNNNIVFDDVQLTPRLKSIDFSSHKK